MLSTEKGGNAIKLSILSVLVAGDDYKSTGDSGDESQDGGEDLERCGSKWIIIEQ
jgi:hypothetical protein